MQNVCICCSDIHAFRRQPLMEKLNLTFQREAVNLSDIQPVVDSTKASLQRLLTMPGHNEQEFSTTVTQDGGMFQTIKLTYCDRQPAFQQAWTTFIEQLIQALMNRFPDDQLSIVSALANVLDRQKYPPSNLPGHQDAYAARELTVLTHHYATTIMDQELKMTLISSNILWVVTVVTRVLSCHAALSSGIWQCNSRTSLC